MPHLPSHGGSQNGSPDMRLAASNLSLGSQNATQSVGGRDIGGGGGVKKFSDGHHLPTIWHKGSKGIFLETGLVELDLYRHDNYGDFI